MTDIRDILKGLEGRVEIQGWLHNRRSSGGILFYIVRDGTGYIQCTLKRDKFNEEFYKELERLPLESCIIIKGVAKADKRAPDGYEIEVDDVKIVSKAYPNYPIGKKQHGPSFLLDHRHLAIRSPRMLSVMLVRAKLLEAAREWFKSKGYLEVQVPTIISAACEGGSTLFEVKYFDKKAYLTQSWQLYGEAMIQAFGRCYTIAPSFRAEKSKTRRHLTEFWHLEAEIPFCDMEMLMKTEEELVTHIVHTIAKDCRKELEKLGRDPEDLLRIQPPFPRITYRQAIEILQKDGVDIEYGDDIGADEEAKLTKHFDLPFFVTHFPRNLKAFYHKPDPNDPTVTLSVDMLAPEGYGEIIGSGVRIESYEELMKRIEECKLNPKDYKWYLDLRKWGAVPHAGFGLGVERTVMWICKLKHIRDAIAFPRLINRVYP